MTVIVNIGTYRTKPHEVQAVKWEGSALEAAPVINWVLAHGGDANYVGGNRPIGEGIALRNDRSDGSVHRGFARPGDYIVKDEHDQFDVAAPASFEAHYQKVNP